MPTDFVERLHPRDFHGRFSRKGASEIQGMLADSYPDTRFNLSAGDPDTVAALAKEYDRLAQKYPLLADTVKSVQIAPNPPDHIYAAAFSGHSPGTARNRDIMLSKDLFSPNGVQFLDDAQKEQTADGTAVPGFDKSRANVLTHEAGHVLMDALYAQKYPKYADAISDLSKLGRSLPASQMPSKNAAVDDGEALADGFTYLELHGGNPGSSPYTKKLKGILDEARKDGSLEGSRGGTDMNDFLRGM